MKKSLCLLVMMVFCGLQAGPLKVGWGMRDIGTTDPIRLSGMPYERISQKVLDELSVTALVVDDGKDSVIFLSADLIKTPEWLGTEVRAKVKKLDPAVPADKIFIFCTHTHSNAGITGRTNPLSKYHEFLVKQCTDAVIEAWNRRAPGKVAYGYDFAATAFNRRSVYRDGVSRLLGKHSNDQFSHAESMNDPFVQFLFTYDMNDKLTGAIVNVPSPSQALCFSWRKCAQSADFWAPVRDMIRKRHDGAFVLAQCSAAAEAMPNYRFMNYGRAQDRRWQLNYGKQPEYPGELECLEVAERIVDAFERTLPWAGKERFDNLPLFHATRKLELTKFQISDKEAEQAKRELAKLEATPKVEGTSEKEKKQNEQLESRKHRFRRLLQAYEGNKAKPKLPVEIHVVRIGDIAFAGNPFELSVDFGKRIQGRSPFVQTFVVQLAEGGRGPDYLPTERSVKNKGYGATPQDSLVGPQGGAELVEETVTVLKELDKAAPQLQPAERPSPQEP